MVIRKICLVFCIVVIVIFNYLFLHIMIIRITFYSYIVTDGFYLFTFWYLDFLRYDNMIFIYLFV